MLNSPADLINMSNDELIEIANGKLYYHNTGKNTFTREDIIREAKIILEKRARKTPLTDVELEIAILRRYVEHYDRVGPDAHKCARELDMGEVISEATGQRAGEVVTKRWHARLAPPSPYATGFLRPCSDSTVNNSSHRYHARAYFEPGKAPAWERIAELESKFPARASIEKEKEQKFGILNSPRQAIIDFASYCSGLTKGANIGVIFLDIDNFKLLNTRFTESIVDQQVLVPFQQLISAACLYRGEAYRHGGEEFLVLLPNHNAEEVIQFAERLRRRIEAENFFVGESSVQVTVSVGIALWPNHGKTIDALVAKANSAEHEAKAKGKNRVEAYGQGTT